MGTYQRWCCVCRERGVGGALVWGKVGNTRGGTEAPPLGVLTNKKNVPPMGLGEGSVQRGLSGTIELKSGSRGVATFDRVMECPAVPGSTYVEVGICPDFC